MRMLTVVLVFLAIEDAQEMFQLLYVYVHVYACWGCGSIPRFFMLWARLTPGETVKWGAPPY
jgi:hypothetical protein